MDDEQSSAGLLDRVLTSWGHTARAGSLLALALAGIWLLNLNIGLESRSCRRGDHSNGRNRSPEFRVVGKNLTTDDPFALWPAHSS